MSRLRESRGVALVIVLTGITILAAFSAEFSYRTRVDVRVASNLEKQIQAYFHARSAMEIVRLTVMSQKFVDAGAAAMGMKSSGLDLWRFACLFAEVFNTSSLNLLGVELMNLKGTAGLGVEKGGFSCEIVPEDSKINLNAVGTVSERKALFTKLYALLRGQVDPDTKGDRDDRKAAELILNIMDWVDPDDERSDIDSNGNFVQAGGAGENLDYSRYGYKARNAKMDSAEEVRLIEGMTDDLYCRFGRNFTVYNVDKVNVNDADPLLIRALVCDNLTGDPYQVCGPPGVQGGLFPMDLAMLYLEQCRNMKRAIPGDKPFYNENEFLQFFGKLAQYDPRLAATPIQVNAATLRPMIGTKSKVLRVVARGWVGQSGHQITAVIDSGSTNWIYWKESGFDAATGM